MPRGDGPFQVIKRINDNSYELDMPNTYLGSNSFNVTVPSRTRALTKSRSKSTPGVKVNTRRCLGEETPSASVVKKVRRQGKASPR